MSTRCNIIIKDDSSKLYFYRHSDGYPEVTGKDLKDFVKGYNGKLRTNVGQSAGWLIVHGHLSAIESRIKSQAKYGDVGSLYAWKVGDYEPTDCVHGDIDYLYTIDLSSRTLTCESVWDNKIEFTEVF